MTKSDVESGGAVGEHYQWLPISHERWWTDFVMWVVRLSWKTSVLWHQGAPSGDF